MTELSFLIDLLLNHKLAKATKDAIAERIKEVEGAVRPFSQPINYLKEVVGPAAQGFTPAILTTMKAHDSQPIIPVPYMEIAQTPAAAEAMKHREALMSGANSASLSSNANLDRNTGRPRKF